MTTNDSTKHTPGPWAVSRNLAAMRAEGVLVTPIELGEHGTLDILDRTANAEANARLIAAAPALLEACEAALGAIKEQGLNLGPITFDLAAAIARATGPAGEGAGS